MRASKNYTKTASRTTGSAVPKMKSGISSRFVKAATSGTYKYLNSKYPNAAPYVRMVEKNILGGKKIDSFIADKLVKGLGNSGLSIPGYGVIPASRTAYGGVTTNKGSGVTKTSYTFGTKNPVPDSIKNSAARFVWLSSDASQNFNVSNPTNVTQGTGQYTFLNAFTMVALDGYLSQLTTAPRTESSNIYVKDVYSKVSITSAANINQSLRIYECVAKENSGNALFSNPEGAWQQGIDTLSSSQNPDSSSFRMLGLFPGNSPAFRTYWHVDNYFDIELKAGASHIHESRYNINTKIQRDMWSIYGTSHTMAGFSRAYLFVLNTTPVHDAATEANVAMGIGSVDINIQQSFEYYPVLGSLSYLNWSIGSDTVTTPNVVTDGFVESSVVN